MFNLHTHTKYSHDGKCSLFELVKSAAPILDGIAITEHIDFIKPGYENIIETAKKCYDDVLKAREIYGDKIKILMGGEFGEENGNIALGKELRKVIPFDMISCSHHIISELGSARDYGYDYDFKNASLKDIDYFMNLYVDGLIKMVLDTDVDVLCHMTLPMRYLIRSGNCYDITRIDNKFEELLKVIIKKGVALEVNTSEYESLNLLMPSEHYLKAYKALGGSLVTIGSDAHDIAKLTSGLSQAASLLKELGFKNYCYFEKRKPIFIEI